jgi:hypothetical protein
VSSSSAGLVPSGAPVQRGRVHLGRLRPHLPDTGLPVVVAVGFSSVCWLGPSGVLVPDLGRMTYRSETSVDRRGRVVLDRRVRAWLALDDPAAFEALLMPAPAGAGVLVVPVADFARRLGEVPQ